MSIPEMRGYNRRHAWASAAILDADNYCFKLPVVEPAGSVVNYSAWWYNFGYAYLYNGQLSLVVGGTLDTGADADTIDVMNIGALAGGDWLHHTIPATATNTAGWTYPMQDPFRPFIDFFVGGVKWDPPLGAAIGIIRKCFQWDGSYYPDTWDYIWYPMGNGYLIDNAFYDNPMHSTIVTATQIIEADGACSTGYRLAWYPDPVYTGSIEYTHDLAGDPWYDSVDNATGYVIETKLKRAGTGVNAILISAKDGAYTWGIYIYGTEVKSAGGFVTSWSYSFDTTAVYNTYKITVKGTVFKLYIDGTLRATGTLDSGSATKSFTIQSATGSYQTYIDHIKYFLNGNTPPVY